VSVFLSEFAGSLIVLPQPQYFHRAAVSHTRSAFSRSTLICERRGVTWTCSTPSPTCQSSCHSLSLHKKKIQHKTPQPNPKHSHQIKNWGGGRHCRHWASAERGSSPALGADGSPSTTSCSHSAPLTSAATEISLLCLQPVDWGIGEGGRTWSPPPPTYLPLGQQKPQIQGPGWGTEP
jgi:hypothetical protein